MILKNFFDSQLAHASYLVGDPGVGEAVVIDPNRDVDAYLDAAEAEGLRIVAVTETHIHADFVSGARELAARTGATLYLSDEGKPDWEYAYADEPNVRRLHHGDAIRVGALRLDILATPGHTPEHVVFVLTDEAVTELPVCAFTGDFLFVGDVGRPDLLERAAGIGGTMEAGARDLYRSLQRFRSLPASLLLWPAHGAGSPCGKSLGSVPATSLGYELQTNWAFQASSEEVFVEAVLAGQPEPPAYFKEMKRINRDGPERLDGFRTPGRLPAVDAAWAVAQRKVLLDIRSRHEAVAGTLPGAVSIPLGKSFALRAGSVLPFGEPVYLLAGGEEAAREASRHLALIGYGRIAGWFGPESLSAFAGDLQRLPSMTAEQLLRGVEDALVVDVRGAAEVAKGRIPGSVHIPLGDLPQRASELPTGRKLIVHCAGGVRSVIGATVLQREGFNDVVNLDGGYAAYRDALETEPITN